jgi:hypothetical protein
MRLFKLLLGLLLSPFVVLVPRAVTPTSADLTTLSDIFKEVYDPVIAEQQNLEASTWKDFEEGDDELGGQGWIFETKMQGNQEGIGARAEKGALPSAGYQRWVQGLIYWRNQYGCFEITGQAIEAARNNMVAFANSKTEEIEGLTKDVIKDLNRQFYGDGQGYLAKISEAASGAQKVCYVKVGIYLRTKMMVDIYDTDLTAINSNSNQIDTLEAAPTGTYPYRVKVTLEEDITTALAENDIVLREDSHPTILSQAGYEIEGLAKIIDDGSTHISYLGISRATYPAWKGQLLDNGGTARNLSLDLLQQGEDAVTRAAGRRPDWVRMNLGQRRKYFDLVGPDKRYMTGRIDGGYERLDYNGNELTIDVDHPVGEITMLCKATVKKYFLRKLGLLDFDGLVLRQVTGYDQWRGYVGAYLNLGCKRPNCNVRITDLVEPAGEAWVW